VTLSEPSQNSAYVQAEVWFDKLTMRDLGYNRAPVFPISTPRDHFVIHQKYR